METRPSSSASLSSGQLCLPVSLSRSVSVSFPSSLLFSFPFLLSTLGAVSPHVAQVGLKLVIPAAFDFRVWRVDVCATTLNIALIFLSPALTEFLVAFWNCLNVLVWIDLNMYAVENLSMWTLRSGWLVSILFSYVRIEKTLCLSVLCFFSPIVRQGYKYLLSKLLWALCKLLTHLQYLKSCLTPSVSFWRDTEMNVF